MSYAPMEPEIWTTESEGEQRAFLVCGARWVKGKITKGKPITDDQRSFDYIAHPIALEITNGARKICHIKDSSHDWHIKPVDAFGMSRKTAQAALAELWRLIDTKFDMAASDMKIKFIHSRAIYKNHSAIWKMLAMIEWDQWERAAAPMSERVKHLHLLGYADVTEKSLARTAEKHGL